MCDKLFYSDKCLYMYLYALFYNYTKNLKISNFAPCNLFLYNNVCNI